MPENLSKKNIFIIIWLVAIILTGTFLGNNYVLDWIEHVSPFEASEKYLQTSEAYQVQIPASNAEYALWVAVIDNTSVESQTDTTYIFGSIQVYFNDEREVVYNGSSGLREFDDPEGLTLYAPAAFNLIHYFKNPDKQLNITIVVVDARASGHPIWWVRFFRNDKPLIPFIYGFVLGGVFISIICTVIYGFVFWGKNQ
ncbi:MAG: hypothetical protein ACFFDC_13100 [Promethearchaeota archaeon]